MPDYSINDIEPLLKQDGQTTDADIARQRRNCPTYARSTRQNASTWYVDKRDGGGRACVIMDWRLLLCSDPPDQLSLLIHLPRRNHILCDDLSQILWFYHLAICAPASDPWFHFQRVTHG